LSFITTTQQAEQKRISGDDFRLSKTEGSVSEANTLNSTTTVEKTILRNDEVAEMRQAGEAAAALAWLKAQR